MEKNNVILLLSGGIDSTTLLAWLSDRGRIIHALSFDYGQRHKVELEFARKNAMKYNAASHRVITINNKHFSSGNGLTDGTLSFKKADRHTSPIVPSRNALLLINALAFAEANHIPEIYAAFNKDDNRIFKDCSIAFVNAMNKLIAIQSDSTPAPVIIAPFIKKTKAVVVQTAAALGVDLSLTISCYEPEGTQECGVCPSCKLKREALQKNAKLK